jgi:small-conductance mechanosensitive channel
MLRKILVVIIIVVSAASTVFAVARQEKSGPTPPEEATLPEGQVMLDGKLIFAVKGKVFSYSPTERARLINDRLIKLLKSPFFRVDSISVIDGDASTDIVAGDSIIMSVTDSDARVAGKTRQETAREYAGKIKTAIEEHNREYSLRSILFGTLYAFIATLVLVVLLIINKRLFPKCILKIESWKGTRIRSIKIQSLVIFHEDRIVASLKEMVKWLRILIFFALIFLYFPFVLSFFPWTRGLSAKIFDYIATPVEKVGHAMLSYLPNIYYIIVISVFAHLIIKVTRFFFSGVERGTMEIPGFYPEWANPTFRIVRFLIIALAVVIAAPYLPGSQSPAFKGVSIFLGVLLSLGSTSAVANIVAGLILTYMRALKLGDRVKIADTVGDVVENNLLVTRIRTIKNVDITIPNTMVLGSHIENYSSSAKAYGLILHTRVTIGYDVPWRKTHELLISAATATENILELPSPFVLQTGLDDFYVTYELNAYSDKPSLMARTYSELHQNIQDRFNGAGVEIMSPHCSQIRDGNRIAIPEQYIPRDYVPKGLRIFQTKETGEEK